MPQGSASVGSLLPHYVSGWCAGMINVTVTFPINKVIFRQQIHGLPFRQALRQVSKEGPLLLYRGLGPPLCQKSLQICLMYGLFNTCYNTFPSYDNTKRIVLAACLAGTIEALVATPFERGQSLLQTPAFHGKIKNTLDLRHHLVTVKQWYRGLGAILFRNTTTNSLFFLSRDPLSRQLNKFDPPKLLSDFICGACLGALNSTLIYPVNVVKSYQQKQISTKNQSLFTSCKMVLKERNYKVRKLYLGVQLNFSRSLISWGIINATYEFLIHRLSKSSRQYY